VIVEFIDAHRDEHGVEPICAQLQIAPSTYYAHRSRPPSARSVSDATTTAVIERVHAQNYGVYGARKVHAELHRQGHRMARCTVERLMHAAGLRGLSRAKGPRTTVAGIGPDIRPDLWNGRSPRPARTSCGLPTSPTAATFSGWVYAAFVIDVFSRRVVGWQLSAACAPTWPSTRWRWGFGPGGGPVAT
jgi:putative transposase